MSLFRFCVGFPEERLQQILMRTCQDVGTHQFTDLPRRAGARVHGRFDATDIALAQDGDQAATDRDCFDETHVGGFDHRIAGLNAADVAFRFYHA